MDWMFFLLNYPEFASAMIIYFFMWSNFIVLTKRGQQLTHMATLPVAPAAARSVGSAAGEAVAFRGSPATVPCGAMRT